jgi:energy-coupling factor transporter transmembrane protein EcfT
MDPSAIPLDTGSSNGAAGGVLIVFFLIYVIFGIAYLWAGVRIIQKAGFSGWWILTLFVPILNVIMFFIFAFTPWPSTQRGMGGGSYYPSVTSAPSYGQVTPPTYGQVPPAPTYGQIPPQGNPPAVPPGAYQ